MQINLKHVKHVQGRSFFHLDSNIRETTLHDTVGSERLLSHVRDGGNEVVEQKETLSKEAGDLEMNDSETLVCQNNFL